MRAVHKIYQNHQRHWVGNGFWVQSLFSHMEADKGTNPFLLLDYAAPYHFAPNDGALRGVGAHPHKGFETVTIAYQGEVAHRDSSGGGGVIHEGDVQWMTAGSGIVHEEFHSAGFSRTGGLFEMVQLWVNLPAKYKHTPARYQHLPKQKIPQVVLPHNAGRVRVIAGQYGDTAGAAHTFSELNVWDIALKGGASATFAVPDTHSLSMVVLRGEVTLNTMTTAVASDLVVFEQNAGVVQVAAGAQDVTLLLLSGVPIDEPVAGYGPFVMNTVEEIRCAIDDYNHGRFGSIESGKDAL